MLMKGNLIETSESKETALSVTKAIVKLAYDSPGYSTQHVCLLYWPIGQFK